MFQPQSVWLCNHEIHQYVYSRLYIYLQQNSTLNLKPPESVDGHTLPEAWRSLIAVKCACNSMSDGPCRLQPDQTTMLALRPPRVSPGGRHFHTAMTTRVWKDRIWCSVRKANTSSFPEAQLMCRDSSAAYCRITCQSDSTFMGLVSKQHSDALL